MSSGDIDVELGPETGPPRHRIPIINREYDVPFGAGIAADGSKIYIDRHLHTRFRGVDISNVLATHELKEWEERGPYSDRHHLANRAEFDALRQVFPSEDPTSLWRAYNNFLDPQIKRDEKENIERPPPDLALYPYEGEMRAHLIKKGVQDDGAADGGRMLPAASGTSQQMRGGGGKNKLPPARPRRGQVDPNRTRSGRNKTDGTVPDGEAS